MLSYVLEIPKKMEHLHGDVLVLFAIAPVLGFLTPQETNTL
jgi:hypothetical protein